MFRPNGSVAMSSRTWSSQLLNIYEPIRSWDDIKHEFLLVNVLRLQFTITYFLFCSKTFQIWWRLWCYRNSYAGQKWLPWGTFGMSQSLKQTAPRWQKLTIAHSYFYVLLPQKHFDKNASMGPVHHYYPFFENGTLSPSSILSQWRQWQWWSSRTIWKNWDY